MAKLIIEVDSDQRLDFCCFFGGAMVVDTINEDVKEKEVPDIG